MGIIQKDALRTTLISYAGIGLGYLNKGILFLIILSTDQIGLVSILITVGTLFAYLAGFGTAFTTLKFLPYFKDESQKHFGFLSFIFRIVLLGIVLTTASFILFRPWIENQYIEKSAQFVEYYYWVVPIGIGYVYYLLFEAYLRSFFKNILSVFAYEIILRLFVTLSLVLYAFKIINFDWFVKVNSLIYLIPPFILMCYLYKQGELNLHSRNIQISKRFKKLMVQFSLYNYLNAFGVTLVISLDVMMIAQMVGLEATGVYSTVIFIASALLVPHRSLIRISSPLVAEYWKQRDMDAMNDLYKKSGSIFLLVGLASFIIIWLNIDLLFSFLKPEFQPGIWVFFALMMGRFFEMFFGLTGIIFTTSKMFKYDIYYTIVFVCLVYALNVQFIPKWGIVGAAISTAIAFAAYNLGRYFFIYKKYKLNPFEKNQFIIIALAVVCLLVGEFVGSLFDSLWIRAIVVTCIYLITFIFPIYYFKLEEQSINYFKNGIAFAKKKLKRS
ncbi:MAG TPA: polysaccharide biosynthesis C-terminal domain-containing protein [Taishania sp.]|nr:polysaccharide biosynthesis C-terminal domain-containing protein [Taishania sp.]